MIQVMPYSEESCSECGEVSAVRAVISGNEHVLCHSCGQVAASELMDSLALAQSDRIRQEQAEAAATPPLTPEVGEYLIYTDGGCVKNPGPCGYGVVFLAKATKAGKVQKMTRKGFLGEGTNNVAELTAILVALRSIAKPPKRISLYTDSRYAIGVLDRGNRVNVNQELVEDAKQEIARLRESSHLTFHFVRGHKGHKWNELADQLATSACQNPEEARTCSVCHMPQKHCPSGWICSSGHGGAPSHGEEFLPPEALGENPTADFLGSL